MDDNDFDQACENADPVAMRLYREEAKAIDRLQKQILEIVASEEPYDVFICYKETDENGERTEDSVLAQEIYDALTDKSLKVFFSRISLEDKLGHQYEPYIYAALSSAKIMLAVGTKFEYYNSVWVKNEWSRFLDMMKTERSKKLIPCFKDLDAYDIPKEFMNLQAQDMGKIGWIQDLTRGVEKLLGGNKSEEQQKPQVQENASGAQLTAAVKRGYLALEDSDWDAARQFFDSALNYDAECPDAYLGIMLAEYKIQGIEALKDIDEKKTITRIEQNPSFIKFKRFATEEQKESIFDILRQVSQQLTDRVNQTKEKVETERKRIQPAQGMIALRSNYLLGVQADGKVRVHLLRDNSQNVKTEMPDNFYGITSVAFGDCRNVDLSHVIGLRADGTVTTGQKGWNKNIAWNNIKQVSMDSLTPFALSINGTVSCLEVQNIIDDVYNEQKLPWNEITSIASCRLYTVGTKADGTVMVNTNTLDWDMSQWRDIVAVSPTEINVVGLRKDGTVITTGDKGIVEAEKWHNRKLHVIDQQRCTVCGQCKDICKFDAIVAI